ncbi:hypothetical protein ACWOAH_04865 [Vagococcus vulneris]|uniref:DNA topology modulation protein FlaR n=1 Tax=Vagococcus vulneris TaxID=1977869 RepID=A0A429ZZW1_9ENTE|nr:hypothetical protein [Vagococcus vulneris]RST99592.1 hypothetical protein CBF37_04500 [Vagococcus vulneris]
MRIRLIGYAGSGKTSLMQKLEKDYKLPGISLDDFLKIKDKQQRFIEVNKHIEKFPSWVVEGVQVSQWTKGTFEEANLIVLLDYPLLLTQYRVVKRTIKQFFELKRSMKQRYYVIKRMFKLFKWNRNFKKRLPQVKEALYQYPVTLMIIESPNDLNRLYDFINHNKNKIRLVKSKNSKKRKPSSSNRKISKRSSKTIKKNKVKTKAKSTTKNKHQKSKKKR